MIHLKEKPTRVLPEPITDSEQRPRPFDGCDVDDVTHIGASFENRAIVAAVHCSSAARRRHRNLVLAGWWIIAGICAIGAVLAYIRICFDDRAAWWFVGLVALGAGCWFAGEYLVGEAS